MELRALGVRLALDDFGSGYSSLSYLQKLPFDKLKIDRSFVSALERSANAAVIIQAIVTLGRALGMEVVIEGVETEEQRALLRLVGCSEMQGYLFARPSPREGIDRILRPANRVRPTIIASVAR
jgi:EAL domain-containing protein (putative c-di-GMP-specific phosphodiesterase class I)